jgi:hypothetical protein
LQARKKGGPKSRPVACPGGAESPPTTGSACSTAEVAAFFYRKVVKPDGADVATIFAGAWARFEWHEEVARAIRAAIEPLSGKAPAGESIEVTVRVGHSIICASYLLDGQGVTETNWTEED